MQKPFFVLLIFFLSGLVCTKVLSKPIAINDSIAIEQMLTKLHQLKGNNLDSAFKLSEAIQQESNELHYKKGLWEAQIEQGIVYHGLGHPDSALSIINKVLKETRNQGSRLLEIKANLGLAYVYQQTFNFQAAIKNLLAAEKLLKNEDAFDIRFDVLNRLGIVHRAMKDFTSALKYFNLLENNYLRQLNTEQQFFLFMNKGNVYADQKKYDKTEEQFKKAYEKIKMENSPANMALISYNLGALYYRQKRYAEAEDYISKSLDAYLKIGNQSKLELCYRVLGSIYLDKKDNQKAEKYFNMAMNIAKVMHNPNAIMANCNNLYLTHWNLGYYKKNISDMDKALNYYQKYNLIKDSLYKIETTAKVLELEKQYETEKKNNQIALLEKENQHQEDQIRIQHAQRNYLFLIIILVSGILGIFVYFFYYYKKVNKQLHLQRKRILNQKNLISVQNVKLQKSITTQNKLFSIIAHDLRSPLASIYNISNLIGFYIEDKNYEALGSTAKMMDQKTDQILELTDNLLNWARSQTENLQPLFAPISLKEILNECLDLYSPIAIDKDITIVIKEQNDTLIWADKNMIKTICRNLINNAIKFTHRNGIVKIWAEEEEQIIRISIKDSGIGIDKNKLDSLFEIGQERFTRGTEGEKSTGLGLSVCKEFVNAMQGKIWVESDMGIGSQFTVELFIYNPIVHKSKYSQTQKPKIQAPVSFN